MRSDAAIFDSLESVSKILAQPRCLALLQFPHFEPNQLSGASALKRSRSVEVPLPTHCTETLRNPAAFDIMPWTRFDGC